MFDKAVVMSLAVDAIIKMYCDKIQKKIDDKKMKEIKDSIPKPLSIDKLKTNIPGVAHAYLRAQRNAGTRLDCTAARKNYRQCCTEGMLRPGWQCAIIGRFASDSICS